MLVGLANLVLVEGWVSPALPLSTSFRMKRIIALHAVEQPDNVFFDDEECYDLCDMNEDGTQAAAAVEAVPTTETTDDEIARSLQKVTRQERDAQAETDRIRLEMTYEMFRSSDDCDLEDVTTCSERCTACHGAGTTSCRCCQGSKRVSMIAGAPSMSCPVCNANGVEECSKCHGSGWIAPWTELADFTPDM